MKRGILPDSTESKAQSPKKARNSKVSTLVECQRQLPGWKLYERPVSLGTTESYRAAYETAKRFSGIDIGNQFNPRFKSVPIYLRCSGLPPSGARFKVAFSDIGPTTEAELEEPYLVPLKAIVSVSLRGSEIRLSSPPFGSKRDYVLTLQAFFRKLREIAPKVIPAVVGLKFELPPHPGSGRSLGPRSGSPNGSNN